MALIRPATPDDADGIAQVQVSSWQTTYVGIMPDEMLRDLSVEQRAAWWLRALSNPQPAQCAFVAEVDGQIVGFASGGAEIVEPQPNVGAVYTIYLLESHQRKGIGRALMLPTVEHLYKQGFDTLLIWVATENPSRGFYEALGGQVHTTHSDVYGGKEIPEVSYRWDDLPALIERVQQG